VPAVRWLVRHRELIPKMTNHSGWSNHKICGSTAARSADASRCDLATERPAEAGYTLVALLALMTILSLFAMAVAPSAQQQALREREKEAIFRGEQIADAIRDYYRYRVGVTRQVGDASLPTSMDQLLQGIPIPSGAKNRMILRASAARDPLTIEGEWRFIRPRSESLIDFQQSVMFYAGNVLPPPRDQQIAQLQQFAVPALTSLVNLGRPAEPRQSSSIDDDSSGPFVGVASRSRRSSVLTYYGIEEHSQWIFTPLFRN
jgi:type II secretory pathway pseudopilin PulG